MGNGNKRTGPDYLDMTDAEFKKLNKAMHNTAKSGGAASQDIQNKYALELARRRKNNKSQKRNTFIWGGRKRKSRKKRRRNIPGLP